MISLPINRGANEFHLTEVEDGELMIARANGHVAAVNMPLGIEGATKEWVDAVSDSSATALGLATKSDHAE
jgi:hypothetical protein